MFSWNNAGNNARAYGDLDDDAGDDVADDVGDRDDAGHVVGDDDDLDDPGGVHPKKGDKVSKTADPFKEGQLTLHLTPSVLPHQPSERQARQGIPAQTGVSLKSGLG